MGACQGEIDRVLKEVHEGVQMLDTVFNKVFAADIDVNQRVTFEAELKKEISKLQSHRDGIATWIQSSEINDNKVSASHAQALMDARKLIEREMERFEKHQFVDSAQVHSSSYLSINGTTVSWSTQGENHSLRETGLLSNSGYSHDQHVEAVLRNVEDGTNPVPTLSTSSSVPANLSQNYSGYAAYPNNDSYGYNSSGYAAYYNQYQQQSNHQYQQQSNHQYQQPANHQYQQPTDHQYQPPPDHQYQPPPNHQYQQPPNHQYQQESNHQYQQESNHQYQQESNHQYQQQPNYQYQHQSNQFQQQSSQTYPHHVGAYQNTGAPHQPLSSLQNTGSYAGPTSYPSTYYNPGDYQTSGSYSSGTYGTQPNLWQGGQYATYSSHQYPNYTPGANTAYNSTAAAATSQYQQQYKQWEDYYNQTQTEVSCAPGTEHIVASSVSTTSYSAPSGSGGLTSSNNQMPAAYNTSWTPESTTPGSTSIQHAAASGSAPEGYWRHGITAFQNDPPNPAQSFAHKPLEVIPTYDSSQNQHNAAVGQGSTGVYPDYFQASQSHLSSFQTVPKPPESLDSRRVSKVQIPTNPRIASNVPLALLKTDKDSTVPSPASKPAYVSVLMQKPNEKVVSHEAADSMLKAGTFPKSLRGYVERALARCKSDGQKIACQAIMKEVIKKATVDGTLYTRDWDTEPLFPLPNMDVINNEDKQFPKPTSSVTPKHRSPTRRAKSRWEPISQEKMVDRSVNLSYATEKYGDWNNKQYSGGKVENKDILGTKFSLSVQKSLGKNVTRPAKRLRLGDDQSAANDGNNSSDSDKEHGLTKYYSAAISLADSPEEKKRRENRSRRFDKGHGNRAGTNKFRAKGGEAGSTYARQASGLALRRTFEESEESGSRAVEDIDWNALTVKGTCQDLEKRYLRLTSAPDPATVRPEEVLEKALLMIQNSQKNYLYKCDQLKSIRQDLTVQHIRNELTVKVYETHARLAIEYGDLPEYNQCQSQLRTLYAEGIMGCDMEFAAYNLLCVVLHPSNNRELLSAMSRLSANAKKDKAVKHALSVRTAVTSGNYVMFFRLYKSAPNLNTYLMDLYVEKMRYAAIKCVCRSYRPTVPVSYLSQILGFGNALPESEANDEKEVDGVEECVDWLKAHGACLISENPGEILLDTKASTSSLYMPEPEDAVAHGDANLAVNDFFTRSLAV